MANKQHKEKLSSLLENEKLPTGDRSRVEKAIKMYDAWIDNSSRIMKSAEHPSEKLSKVVSELNKYKLYIELDLIFDSDDDFLYRQKGQLKLDNSILEEFLPFLIDPVFIPEIKGLEIVSGGINTFSSLYFVSTLGSIPEGGGLSIRTKDQDFAIAKPLYIRTGFTEDLKTGETRSTYLAYVAAECKTNLDKTMFQEASATAHDIKMSVPGAKYYLLCEWLDMTPVGTAATDIDEVLILRKAKRLGSNIRSSFSNVAGRKRGRKAYEEHLVDNPISAEMIERFIDHIRSLFTDQAMVEDDILRTGYF